MAVGAKYQCTVGEVEKLHNVEVRSVITELVNAAAKVMTDWIRFNHRQLLYALYFGYRRKLDYHFPVELRIDFVLTLDQWLIFLLL